jgi:hypothetical protein
LLQSSLIAPAATPITDSPNTADPTSGQADNRKQISQPTPHGSQAGSPDIAFAARVKPSDAASASRLDQAGAPAPAASLKKQPADAGGQDAGPQTGRDASPNLAQNAAAAAYVKNAEAAPIAPPQVRSAPVARPQATPPLAEPAPKPAAPVNEMVMRISQPGAQNVDVQVSQRAGEVHVAVRTSDSDLAHGFRQGLPELTGRLETSGYRAETWRPEVSMAAPPPAASETRDPAARGGGSENGQSQSGGSKQESGRRNQNQQDQPRWVQDLEESLKRGGPSGDTHGIGN